MPNRVRNLLVALAATGVIAGGGAAIANAATGSTSTTTTTPAATATTPTTPTAPSTGSGTNANCPNM